MSQLDVPGATIDFETTGHISNPAVVLIHAGIATQRMWDPLVPALATTHFVITYDCRGFGNTTSDTREFSEHDDVSALLDHLGVAKAVVVGCSRGGAIAIDLALEAPSRVAALAVIGGMPDGFPDLEPTASEHAILDAMDAALAAGDRARFADLDIRLWAIGPSRTASDVNPAFLDTAFALYRPNRVHADRPRSTPLDPPAYDRLVDITVPTLVAVGDFDLSETLAAFEYLVTSIPNADSVRFGDSAHLPNVEQPEEFNRVFLAWLAGHGL